jgi:CubicO group peptidase (beta-lactamase class C family)
MLIICSASCKSISDAQLEKKIQRIENGLLAEQSDPSSKRMNIEDRMIHYMVPGVSIAMIDDFQIEWAKGYGVLEAGKDQAVTTDTIFQTGSTAKPIVAAVALHFVKDGTLELDRNINDYLLSWKIPENQFTEQTPVTLRQLLSHNAGLDYIPLFGYTQDEKLPNLEQILDGEPPARSDPVRVLALPGSQYSYSNGGYLIVEQLLSDIEGKPFNLAIQDIVLNPLSLNSIEIHYPLAQGLSSRAASGHLTDGSPLPGGWQIFPEMGPGGSWWATPSDLASFYIEIMLAYTGQSELIISQEMAIEMLTPQIEDRGLGPWIGDDGGNRFYFGHPGHNYGYKNYLVFYPERGQGLVIMTNSENGDELYREILNSVNNEYGWVRNNSALYLCLAVIVVGAVVMYLFRRRIRQ